MQKNIPEILSIMIFKEIKEMGIPINREQADQIAINLSMILEKIIADTANEIIGNIALARLSHQEERNSKIRSEMIMKKICMAFDVKEDIVRSRSSRQKATVPRQVYFYLCRLLISPKPTLKTLAQEFNRNHATVIHALKSAEKRIKTDEHFRVKIEEIIKLIEIESELI